MLDLSKSGLMFLDVKWNRTAIMEKKPNPTIWMVTPAIPISFPVLSLESALESVGDVPEIIIAATSCSSSAAMSIPTKMRVRKRARIDNSQ